MEERKKYGKFSPGLFLYTKLGPVSGTKFFPIWLKKFPIDLEHSQLAEKSQFKRLTFPILLKIALFFCPKLSYIFPKSHNFFPISSVPKISQKGQKKPCSRASACHRGGKRMWQKRDSNPGSLAYRASTLPLSYQATRSTSYNFPLLN